MTKLFKYYCFLFLIVVSIPSAYGQISNISDMSGTVLRKQSYQEVNGSPYFVDKWMKGDVKFANGRELKNIALLYDQVKDALLFKGKDNEDYYFNDQVSQFTVYYISDDKNFTGNFRNGFSAKGLTNLSFFEVLYDGKTKLLKRNNKSISESKEYNSATTVKTVHTNTVYYIANSTTAVALKKLDMKSLTEALDATKVEKVKEYVSSNQLNLKFQQDLIRILSFYDTL